MESATTKPVPNEKYEETGLLTERNQTKLYSTFSHQSTTQLNSSYGNDAEAARSETEIKKKQSPWTTLSILFLGVFVSNADASLVLTTYTKIASEFGDLDSVSWLLSSFMLAMSASQPLYGRLSEIYGRKHALIVSYTLFAIGNLGAGLSRSLEQVIAWRAVQGVGGAGMLSLVAIIVADIAPIREVASLRSYVNVLQVSGKMCGGVIGGLLTQSLGWRWAFLIQVPPTVVAIFLVSIALKVPEHKSNNTDESNWAKLKRIDFTGAFTLAVTILALCLVLDLGGTRLSWTSHWIHALLCVAAGSTFAFLRSARYAVEPIFPLTLVTNFVVVTNYAILFFLTMAQNSMMTMVPVYFQATARATTAQAGVYLIPAFAGNSIGGLFAGYWIKKTGRYKAVTIISSLLCLLCATMLFMTWEGGQSSFGSFWILPGGASMGAVSSSAFVGLTSGLAEKEMAVVASGMYLFSCIGSIAGVSGGSALFQYALRKECMRTLQGREDREGVISKALADIGFIQGSTGEVRDLLLQGYVKAFHSVNVLQIVCALFALALAVVTRAGALSRGG